MITVNVWVLDHKTKHWRIISKNVKLQTIYKESEMTKALCSQYKRIWNKIPVWRDEKGFSFREAINLEIVKWVHDKRSD